MRRNDAASDGIYRGKRERPLSPMTFFLTIYRRNKARLLTDMNAISIFQGRFEEYFPSGIQPYLI
jgi:hypothetical protein